MKSALPPSIVDVARLSGFSKATVSRALGNKPRCSSRARDRILKAASRLGYHPNPLMRMIAGRRWKRHATASASLALVHQELPGWKWMDLHLPHFRQRVQSIGYSLDEIKVTADISAQRLADLILSRGIQGMVLGPLAEFRKEIPLDWEKIAAVSVGVYPVKVPVPVIGRNQFQAVTNGISKMVQEGFRRIGLAIFYNEPTPWEQMRRAAAYEAIARLPKGVEILPFFCVGESLPLLGQWVQQHQPDVLFCLRPDDLTAALKKEGIRVPRDLAVMALSKERGDSRFAGYVDHCDVLAHTAIDLVDLQIRNSTGAAQVASLLHLIESEWSPGESFPEKKQ